MKHIVESLSIELFEAFEMARSQTILFFIIIRFVLLFGVLGGGPKELEEYFKWKQIAFASDQYGKI